MTFHNGVITVLVIEDEPLIAMEIEYVVEKLHLNILGPFSDIDSALKITQHGKFDCAVLDVNINGGNTYAIASILQDRGCPFILATGYSDWSVPDHLRSQSRITKPYTTALMEAEIIKLAALVLTSREGLSNI